MNSVSVTEKHAQPEQRRSRWFDPSETQLAVILLAPAALLLGLIVVYPIGKLLYNSFFDIRLSGGLAPSFTGLRNYADALHDPDFWNATKNTLLVTVITVPGAFLVGLPLALLANLPYRVRWPIRLALLLPWALPLAFSGLIFAWFFNTDHGIVNDVLVRLGFEPVMFLLSPGWAFAAVCLTTVWKTSSFVALILLAGLQTIPRSLYEAAEVDGATRLQKFFHITLPMLVPSIVVAMIFRTISALQTFDIPYTMAHGGPGNSTTTLAMLINSTMIDYLDVGYGAALAVFMFAISLAISVVYLKFVRGEGRK
ncbi:carbohydrate ABC transporter permease [Paraburkholderia fungorum]|uniref:carbohydrate ABC transporter permease n=1 Tax=Paraburkholderia fungorum TaxID=134537 RepID=UPI0038BCC568